MALLGEMHFCKEPGPDSWFNLPRGDGVAYCAQEAWIQNDTIKVYMAFVTVPMVFFDMILQLEQHSIRAAS